MLLPRRDAAMPTGAAPRRRAEAGGRLRVVVADDSIVARGLITRWVAEAGFDVVATVLDGRSAISAVETLRPDVVLLDITMPGMDGLTALPILLARQPSLAVIVISLLTQHNAATSFKCLTLGAVDCIPKPDPHVDLVQASQFRDALVSKLEGLSAAPRRAVVLSPAPERPVPLPAALPRAPAARRSGRTCLVIGASTGGPMVLVQLLSDLKPHLSAMTTLIVQHMPAGMSRILADHLATLVGIECAEAKEGDPVTPGRVLLAPGGRHLRLTATGEGGAEVRLDDGPPVHFCRPAADRLFADAARIHGPDVLGVVLTGLGRDGTEGAREIRAAGGAVFVQDEATSTVWGMPGSVVRAALANAVLPLGAMAQAIADHSRGGRP